MLKNIEILLRLLIVVQTSSCEAELSFSSLRCLKTFLRGSMTQKRVNNVMVCHVHQDLRDILNLDELADSSVAASDRLRTIFGPVNFEVSRYE